ncbi:MAG: V4R domain-containing protein, partial [Candidatus Bathyarchaeia archaeon]
YLENIRHDQGDHAVIIHNYLPPLLIKEDEERVLKLIESWKEKILHNQRVEFFTLPKNTFPLFEKKLQAITVGAISLRLVKTEKEKYLTFQISGSCRPEFHLEEFPFIVKDNRLLVRWGDEYTDKIPCGDEAFLQRLNYLREKRQRIRISEGREAMIVNPADRWLLSQIKGKMLDEVCLIYPELCDEIMDKLAQWNILGAVRFEEQAANPPPPLKEGLSILTRFALHLPTPISLMFLQRRSHTIPLEVYNTLRKSVEAFISTQAPECSLIELDDLETSFQEMTARLTAMKTYQKLKEDPRQRLPIKHLPKILSLAIFYGYRMKPQTRRIGENEFEVSIPDCFICKGQKGNEPACKLLSGTILGACAFVFKEKFSCREVRCKAMGDPSCIFQLAKISR